MGALTSIGISAWNWLGKVSLQVALLVCIILLVQVLLRRYLPGRWRYALWLLVIARLTIPWAPESRWSVFNLVTQSRDQAASPYQPRIHHSPLQMPSWLSDSTTDEGALISDMSEQAGNEISEGHERQLDTPMPTADAQAASWDWRFWRQCIWLAGAVMLLSGSLRASLRLWWIVKHRRPVTDSRVLSLLEDSKEQMGVQTIVGLVESNQIKSPALFGFLCPRLLIPQGLLQDLSHDELRYVFLHELAHMKRYDVLLGWITLLLQAIHWFNPLVWLAFYRMRTDREIACDQEVLRHLPERELAGYGNTILVLLNRFSRRQYLPSLVGILEHKTQTERRIKMIATFKKETPVVSVWALGLVVVLASVALTSAIPHITDEMKKTITGQPDPGLYQFIFDCKTQNGKGSAKGLLDCQVTGEGIYLKNGGSRTSNTPMIPLGSIALYHLRNPSLMLKFPLQTSAQWTDHWTGYDSTTRVFLERGPVVLDVGTFSNCLLLETTIEEASPPHPDHSRFLVNSTCGKRYIWLAPGVGLVRMVYQHKDGTTTQMLLTDYHIGADTQAYLPTVHHATWNYLFKSDAHRSGVEETWRLNDTRQAGRLSYTEVTAKEAPNEKNDKTIRGTLTALAPNLDSDKDGLSDFQEIHKYLTNPNKQDSDGDGISDGDWQERREYAYSVRSVLRFLPPLDKAALNDDFQDGRVLQEKDSYIEIEVIHYPFSTAEKAIAANPNWQRDYAGMTEYTKPDITTNWDQRMRQDLLAQLKADGIDISKLTDKQLVEQVSSWLLDKSRSLDKVFTTYYISSLDGKPRVYPGLEGAFEREFNRDKANYNWTLDQHLDYEVLGKGMFYNKTHGSCTSTAVYLTTVLRALGIPTRMIIVSPVVDASNAEQLSLVKKGITHNQIREDLLAALKRSTHGFTNHTFNEVYVGNRWHRLDYKSLGLERRRPFGLPTHLYTFNDLAGANLAATWGWRYGKGQRSEVFRHDNPYSATAVSDCFGKHSDIPNPLAAKYSQSQNPLPNLFILNSSVSGAFQQITDIIGNSVWNKTGRRHDKKSYDEIFVEGIWNRKPGDIVVLLFTLDSSSRIPPEYQDILPKPWGEIEATLNKGKTVELEGMARDLNIIVLAAPARDQLRQLIHDSELIKAVAAAPDAVSSHASVNEIIIEALIDDVSEIWLTSEGIHWEHITRYAKPGLHDGRNEPTLINGKEWFPVWGQPEKERGVDTTERHPLPINTLNFNAELLAVGQHRNAKGIERGSIKLRREKHADVVTVDDRLPLSGSRWYRIRLYRTDELGR